MFFLPAIALSGFLTFSYSETVSARETSQESRKPARADMLAVALDFRSGADLTVFARTGINNQNSRIEGKTADATRNAEAAENIARDLEKSFSAINQLPCSDLGSELTGGTFAPGVYCAPSADLSKEIILDGGNDANGIFVFKIKGTLGAKNDLKMSLLNEAKAQNVFFVAGDSAIVSAETFFSGSILAKNSVRIEKNATVSGKIFSIEGTVNAVESSIGGATGILRICKQQQGTGLENRVFRFRVGSNIHEVQVGQCSEPIQLPVGLAVVEELLDGRTIPTGTFSGRFRLLDINSPTPGALGSVNLPLRTAGVFIQEGDVSNQTVVNFVNAFAVNATVEICKRPVAPSGPNTTPPSTIPVNDQEVSGFFDFTIDATGNTIYTVAVGQCSGPIQVNVPATPAPGQQTALVRITELSEAGFTLESANTVPADRFQSLTLNAGISGINDTSGFPNPRGGYVTATVLEGGISGLTTVNFFNRSNPGRIKVCKIAGPGIPEGTRFRFEVRGLGPSGPGSIILPGVNVARTVDVTAGSPSQPGCSFVEGGFIVGTNALVTELGALDIIPNSASTEVFQKEKKYSENIESLNGARKNVSVFDVVKGNFPAKKSEPGTALSTGNPVFPSKTASAPAALTPFITEFGKISLSTDGLGTNAASGIVQVQKPAGATVRRAFLMAATSPNPIVTLGSGDITINGSPVNFTATAANPIAGGTANNYLGDVTALVKPAVDAAPAGRVDFTIAENAEKNSSIDGVALAVILNDPTQQFDNTIALLFGALSPTGDNFTITLANPINTGAPGFALNMSLGISYSFQGNEQFSTIDVGTNSRPLARLTSSAGGQDDGAAENGALISVGGLDDSTANPANPTAGPDGDPRIDDELYTLAPFVNNNDTVINVNTTNPSNDDNIFFGSFFVGNNTAAIGESIILTPTTATGPVGSTHTVTAAVQSGSGQPIPNREVRFRVLTGPNEGRNGTANTSANGQASFSYTSNGTPGTDTIQACFNNASGAQICSNIVSRTWELTTLPTPPVSRIQSTCGFAPGGTAVQGIAVNPNPNRDSKRAIIPVRREGCEVEYVNFALRPTLLKICKIAGPGIAVGTPFTFDITIDDEGGLFPGLTVAPLTVQAGPAAQGGFCVFAQGPYAPTATTPPIGTFRGGSRVTVTERAAAGTVLTAISSTTGVPIINLPNRRANMVLEFPNAFNDLTFTNTVSEPLSRRPRFDFDGDSKDDVCIYRSGTWSCVLSSNGQPRLIDWGLPEDTIVPEDYDGDRKADAAVYRDGVWHILQSSNGQYRGEQFGASGDVPQPGDFDGDGKADLAVFRPSNGTWYISRSRDGFTGVQFGTAGDKPLPGDFDGDGKADIAVYRPLNGTWYILQSRDGFRAVQFGIASDKIVPADYDGDGKTDPAVYRSGVWYMLQSTAGFGFAFFGIASDRPVPADYNGDGRSDIAVYRDGTWYFLTQPTVQLGNDETLPVPGAYVR